jgi:hypothetical protein
MNGNALWRWAVVLAVMAVIVVNGLANALPLNQQTTGEIANRFEVYFVPAGYVFSIWGLIYLGLIGYGIFQATPGQRENPRLGSIASLFVLSSAANIAWLFLWHYEQFPLTLIAMGALLLSLIAIYLRLGIGRAPVSLGELWLVRAPFSVYLGWVTVATIANVTVVLEYLNWDGWGVAPEVWTVIMLVVGTAIAAAVFFTRGDFPFLLVIIWAFVGIAVEQQGVPLVEPSAWALAAVVAIVVLAASVLRTRRS